MSVDTASPNLRSRSVARRAEATCVTIRSYCNITQNELVARFGHIACNDLRFVRALLKLLQTANLSIELCQRLIGIEAQRRKSGEGPKRGVSRTKAYLARDCTAALRAVQPHLQDATDIEDPHSSQASEGVADNQESPSVEDSFQLGDRMEIIEPVASLHRTPTPRPQHMHNHAESFPSPQDALTFAGNSHLPHHHLPDSCLQTSEHLQIRMIECLHSVGKAFEAYSHVTRPVHARIQRRNFLEKQQLEASENSVAQGARLEASITELNDLEKDIELLRAEANHRLTISASLANSALNDISNTLIKNNDILLQQGQALAEAQKTHVESLMKQKTDTDSLKRNLEDQITAQSEEMAQNQVSDMALNGQCRMFCSSMLNLLYSLESKVKADEEVLQANTVESNT